MMIIWYCKIQNSLPSSDVALKYNTNNVTGRHRGPKRKLRAGYRAPSLYNGRHMLRCVFIVECGVARFLSAMRVFEVRSSSSSPRLPLAKFRFYRGLHCWASPWRKIAYPITHPSRTQSPSLFDAPGPKLSLRIISKSCTIEPVWTELYTDAWIMCNIIWMYQNCEKQETSF